jgi:hypothetical protein
MELHAIGIDLGKTIFHLVGVDASGCTHGSVNVIGLRPMTIRC